jgi:hypothetical protein
MPDAVRVVLVSRDAGPRAGAAIRVVLNPVFPNGRRALTAGKKPRRARQKKTNRAFPQRARDALDFHRFFALERLPKRISEKRMRAPQAVGKE